MSDSKPTSITRRNMLFTGGLAFVGAAGLSLNAQAKPTKATEDVHKYQDFLDTNGIPQVAPANEWKPTRKDILGPYWLQNAPFRGKVTGPLEPGELTLIRGRVWGFDTKKPITNVVLDVWQANQKGQYDMDDPRNPPAPKDFNNRIRLVVDETGYYEYETIFPGVYRAGRDFRPAHIHYLIQAPRYKKLITQIYFKNDPHLEKDHWASKSNLIIDLEDVKNEHGTYKRGTFDIVLEKGQG